MRIQHNIMAMNAYRNYNNNTSALSKNLEKLSSGYKINRAGDDAAGLAISEKMRLQITGLEAAQKNVKDATNLVKTAEGAMQEIQDMIKRMDYLATQSANGTYDDGVDRVQMQKEIKSLMSEIDRIADSANFNGINLLDGGQTPVSDVAFTQATSSTGTASMTITFTAGTAGASKLIGGTLQIGSKIWKISTSTTGTADLTSSADELKIVRGTTTMTDILAAVIDGGGNDNAIESDDLGIKDLDGNDVTVTVASTGNKITVTGAAGKFVDVNTLPTVGASGGLQLQIGDSSHAYNQMRVGINDMHSSKLFMGYTVDISTQDGAKEAVNYIKHASNQVSSTRGDLGAIQNRLDHTSNNLSVMRENIQDAESSIRDTDVADEMMSYTKNNILIQSAQAMLAQANAVPQGVLQLLQ